MEVKITCPCPPKADGEPRHDGDTVMLRDRLDFRAATTIRKAIGMLYLEDPEASAAEVLALLTEHYLLFGIAGWSMVDEKGKPTACGKTAIRRFIEDRPDIAEMIGDEADGLYSEQVMLPLVARAQRSSAPSPTAGSTSTRNNSPPKRPRRSRQSSTTTTPTDATGTITRLPVGGSDSLQSSRSAG
jgi:hypothetical protein